MLRSAVASITGARAWDQGLKLSARSESTVAASVRPECLRSVSSASVYSSRQAWMPGVRLCGMPRVLTGASTKWRPSLISTQCALAKRRQSLSAISWLRVQLPVHTER